VQRIAIKRSHVPDAPASASRLIGMMHCIGAAALHPAGQALARFWLLGPSCIVFLARIKEILIPRHPRSRVAQVLVSHVDSLVPLHPKHAPVEPLVTIEQVLVIGDPLP
jgi:hypothetical protein